jgi:hypothetical protein
MNLTVLTIMSLMSVNLWAQQAPAPQKSVPPTPQSGASPTSRIEEKETVNRIKTPQPALQTMPQQKMNVKSLGRGGVDGGGGDIPQSSVAEVKSAIKSVFTFSLRDSFYNLGLSLKNVKDPYIRRILSLMYVGPYGTPDWEKNQPIYQDIKNTSYVVSDEADGCKDPNGIPHPATVESFSLGAKICFSVPMLRLIPSEDLESQILALTAHEFAHHFGIGEFEAVKFQTFFLHYGRSLSSSGNRFIFSIAELPIPAARTDQRREIIIQNGRQIALSELDRYKPYCYFYVASGEKDFKEALKKASKKEDPVFPALLLSAQGFEVSSIESSGNCDTAKPDECGFTSITYLVNPYFDGMSYEAHGMPLRRQGGESSDSKIVRFECSGKRLRVMDIKLILGDLGDAPNLIK